MQKPVSLFKINTVYSEHGLPKADYFRKLTSGLRMQPDLFIVGAQKAGTNSLANYLSKQNGVIPPWHKEISYFNNDLRFAYGPSWYSSFFATRFVSKVRQQKSGITQITFDASANYFEEIKSAKRIKEFNPKAKIIVLLRNPTMRAWSHYKMAVSYGFEDKSFTEALLLENERINSNTSRHNFAYQRLAYRTKGEYINYLPIWLDTFGDNILVLFYEELFTNKAEELNKIHAFLHLKVKPAPENLIHINKGTTETISVNNFNELNNYYAEFNRQLSELLKRKLPW